MKLKAILEGQKNNTSAYDLVVGSVFKEELNETLDSGSIIISNVEPSRKLELEPYQYVYIYDTESDFEKYFLVDNFIENYVNLDTPYYEYTIALMSETKLLEKIQLPNRTIRNPLNAPQLKVNELIGQFCKLYIPSVKYFNKNSNTWSYHQIIDYQSVIDVNSIFNVDCPDMEFNHPTLRQVLTSLMQVVGCLPRIVNHKLTYVNLRLKPTEFIIPNGRKYIISTSNSSDSYNTSIQTLGENIVGENNIVKNETLGFRDVNNVFLKHTENLKLTTEFPIKEIKSLKMNVPVNFYFGMGVIHLGDTFISNNFVYDNNLTKTKIGFEIYYSSDLGNDIELRYCFEKVSYLNNNFGKVIYQVLTRSEIYQETATKSIVNESYVYSNTLKDNQDYNLIVIELRKGNDYGYYLISVDNVYHFYMPTLYIVDLTSLVFETQARKLNRTDLTYSPETIEDMSKYYYTTLEYTYGNNDITGFSQQYDYVEWYGKYQNILISNIATIYKSNLDYLGELEDRIIKYYFTLMPNDITKFRIDRTDYNIIDNVLNTSLSPYSAYTFNITYIPFNNVNLKFDKSKDIPLPLTQLDNQESAIPSLTAFALREQEKVERIGNNVVKINASNITNLNEINVLNTKYNDSIIFSKEIAYYEDFCNVNYIATKDYVLKNYFTNIQTKYRAYRYVEYANTVLRIENRKYYVYLNTRSFNGSDTLGVGNLTDKQNRKKKINDYFLGNLVNEETIFDTLDYNIKATTDNKMFRNDLSIIKFNNNIALNYRDFDSVSGGIGIENPATVKNLGGYIQKWYNRDGLNYNTYNGTYFVDFSFIPNFGTELENLFLTEENLLAYYNKQLKLPLVVNDDFNPTTYTGKMIYICESRTSGQTLFSQNAPYYKAQDEVLGETIQFEYLSASDDLILGTHFVDYDRFITSAKLGYIEVSENFNYDFEKVYTKTSETIKDIKRNTINALVIALTTELNYIIVAYNDTSYIILAKGNSNIVVINASISDTKSLYCYEPLESDRNVIYKCDKKVIFNNTETRE
ncbi:MAG: hypothetical protein MST00_05780 [Tenericutes bacterium]|nr:hypothetical protein [Mycoplasmatota bacterium]